MKRLSVFLAAAVMSGAVFADTYVQGYTKKDGTYVPGHYRSSPDQNRYNNRSSQSFGGTQRDEFSSGGGATNKSNSSCRVPDDWLLHNRRGLLMGREALRAVMAGSSVRGGVAC